MPHTSLFTSSLWQECETLYPALESLLIKLQDEHGLIVNLLLLALTLDNKGVSLNQGSWASSTAKLSSGKAAFCVPIGG